MHYSKLIENEFTPEWAKSAIHTLSPYPYLADVLVVLSSFAVGALLSLLLFFLLRPILNRFCRRHCELNTALQVCISRMIISFVACLPLVLVSYFVWCDGIHKWVAVVIIKLLWGIGIALLALTGTYAFKSFGLWYKQTRHAEQRPIDDLLSLAISFVWTAAVTIFIAMLVETRPIYLLFGFCAIAVVFLFLLQHTIHSIVASVKIKAEPADQFRTEPRDHFVEIGDWIVMESGGILDRQEINGIVTEISQHTVKVRNWDNALVCFPISDLVNKPFINYSTKEKDGGRCIKKKLLIDQRSIRSLSAKGVEILKGFDSLKDYLEGKGNELDQYNTGRSMLKSRHLTNLGIFRIYAKSYLEQNPSIRADQMLFVRELAPKNTDLPIEIVIYCFSREIQAVPYEEVQSEITEHLLAALPRFGLRVFQRNSDIYQEFDAHIDVGDVAFLFDCLKNPINPNSGNSSGERNS